MLTCELCLYDKTGTSDHFQKWRDYAEHMLAAHHLIVTENASTIATNHTPPKPVSL